MFRADIDFDTFHIGIIPSNPEPFHRINRIPIRECGEPLVDLRSALPDLLLSKGCLPYVRASVVEMLRHADASTPAGYRLRVSTALRTLKMQSDMYWSNYEKLKEQHPDWPKSALRRQTNRFFAPPDVKAPPGHCTGGAVDVGLCREDGERLDHSSPLEGWKAAPTSAAGLSAEASAIRRSLCYVMHGAGFSNCRDEYWHWSYGDSAWAVRAHASEAIYGYIEPPAEDFVEADGPA